MDKRLSVIRYDRHDIPIAAEHLSEGPGRKLSGATLFEPNVEEEPVTYSR